jgi:hypothetical protein
MAITGFSSQNSAMAATSANVGACLNDRVGALTHFDGGGFQCLLGFVRDHHRGGGFQTNEVHDFISLILEELANVGVADGHVRRDDADLFDLAIVGFIGLYGGIDCSRTHDHGDAAGPFEYLFMQAVGTFCAVPECFGGHAHDDAAGLHRHRNVNCAKCRVADRLKHYHEAVVVADLRIGDGDAREMVGHAARLHRGIFGFDTGVG